jgi:Flp pilus assembly protein TadD
MPRPRRIALACGTVVCCAVAAASCWHAQQSPVGGPHRVTFAHDVAPIVFAKCASCHHPGEAAPFSLLTYDDVRRRSRQIVEVTQKRFMPPWLPAEGHGDFVGARRLSDDELQTLKSWADAGSPPGDDADRPAAPTFADGWQLGPPDLVLETPAYTLSSRDRDVFRNFVVPNKLTSPRWVRSIELRPVNPRVTHHARLGVDSSNESVRRDADDGQPGYPGMAWGQDPDGQLVVWAPGMAAPPPTPGVAWRLHPKTTLVLHTHMQPSGKPEVVRFRIGIRFADEPPRQHPAMLRIGTCNIDIPAGARHHVVEDRFVVPIDIDVHTIFPHAHSLCRELHVVAERPDGTQEPMISIDQFDENWHDCYRYREPVRLPRGTRLISTFVYDNSDENLRNRNHPARRVVYGSNANDEMADVYLQVTPVRPDQRAVLMEDYKGYDLRSQVIGHAKSLEAYPDDPWALEALASAYVGLGDFGRATATLEKRLNTGPKAVYPVVSLGLTVLSTGNPVRAEELQRQAIGLDGQYPLAWFGLGKSLAAQKKSEPAEQAFRRAIELAPGFLEARLNLADLHIQRGQLDPAKEVCSTALGDSPEMSAVYLKLAEIHAKKHEYEASLADCQAARRLAPYTHPPKVLLAMFCWANGDRERALTLLQEARTEFADHPMPPLVLGQLARRQQQTRGAREYLTAAASLPMPDNWPASHRHRFLVLLHSERYQLAQQLQDVDLARDALYEWMRCEPANAQVRKMYDQLPSKPAAK